ncbi:MAG: protein tyrosine phosphatase family protein [Caldilineaceae bacterium]|nr:protein tyrosine phosphatase family protein [Caldilineaceae bacterium]
MSVDAIYNYVVLSEALGTAGQPSQEQMRAVADAGYEVVINLDLPNSRYAITDEPGLVTSLGMAYHNIAVDFANPTVADLRRFVDTLDAQSGKKVLVHCAANYRVSTFISLYGQKRWGWSESEADAHIRRLWEPNEVWAGFIADARQSLHTVEDTPTD